MTETPIWIVRKYGFADLRDGDTISFDAGREARDVVKWLLAWAAANGKHMTAKAQRDRKRDGWLVEVTVN